MSSFWATTGRPASRFARRQCTRDTCAQLACRHRRLYTRKHASAPSLTPCTGCRLSTEWRLRGRRRCLYVLKLIDFQTNTYTRRNSAHSLTLYFVIPRTRLKLGEREFSIAAPQAWNHHPTDLKTLRSTTAFKRSSKTFLFRTAYNVWFLGLYIPLLLSNCSGLSFFSVPDIVMRRRSICRRRTKSIVVVVFVFIHWSSTDIARQRTKTIGHSNSLLGYSVLVFPDSG